MTTKQLYKDYQSKGGRLFYDDWVKSLFSSGVKIRVSKQNLTKTKSGAKQSPEMFRKRAEKIHYYLMNRYSLYFGVNVVIGEVHVNNYLEFKTV